MRSARSITKPMSCSTSSTDMPPSRSWPQQRGEPLLLHVPQSRGRLVEQQQHRIDAQRARDLDDALLAERQRCRRAVSICSARPTRSIWRAASASNLASSARSSRSMLASAPARPRRWAPIATFSSTVMSGTSLTCWKVRAMPSCATSCGGALSMVLPSTRDGAAGGGQHAGDQVEGRALAGAVGADQRDDLAGLDVERHIVDGDHAAELLARALDLQQRRRGVVGAAGAAGSASAGAGPLARRRVTASAPSATATRRSAPAAAAPPAGCRTRWSRAGPRREHDRADSSAGFPSGSRRWPAPSTPPQT